MSVQSGAAQPIEFGPFSVDAAAGELRRRGIRVRLSGQPMQILLVLLARPGEVVTREQLRNQVWDKGTFVDFEGGLNVAVAKLRRALEDSAEHPRYIETIPGVGYRFIGSVINLQPVTVPAQTAESARPPAQVPARQARPPAWLAGLATVAAVCLYAAWQWSMGGSESAPSMMLRLTNDPGFSGTPAISPDGRLLAYSSDRNRDEGLDLFVRQVSGGEPLRLTFDGMDNTTPEFSPDGGSIVFRSGRNGGGIYEIPSLGGEARLIASGGFNPRYSPDGSRVAYWVGDARISAAVPGSGQVWVVPRSGEQPRLLAPNLTASRYPVWSPDGMSLLLLGYSSKRSYETSALDWWLASDTGERVLRTGTYQYFVQAGLFAGDYATDRSALSGIPILPAPKCWLPASNIIVFSANKGDTKNLWETGFSVSTSKPAGVLRRLTTSSGNETELSCTSDIITFTNVDERTEVSSIRFDPNSGKMEGSLERIFEDPAYHYMPSLTQDGGHLVVSSARSGRLNVWMRDLATGKESQVTKSATIVHKYPEISPSGAKITYSATEPNSVRRIYVTTPGGVSEKLCDNCLRATSWSRDEKSVLMFAGLPYCVQLLDIASHRQTPVVSHPAHSVLNARFSPDNRWISFTERVGPNRGRILLAPMDGPRPIPESAWIPITEEGPEDWANWSPDGKVLYFTSSRDGHACLWAQRVDPESRRPAGDAFAVLHLHGRLSYMAHGWTISRGRLAMVLSRKTSNIWMIPRQRN